MLTLSGENFPRSSSVSPPAWRTHFRVCVVFFLAFHTSFFYCQIILSKTENLFQKGKENSVFRCALLQTKLCRFFIVYYRSIFFHIRSRFSLSKNPIIRICDERLSIRLQLVFSIGLKGLTNLSQ